MKALIEDVSEKSLEEMLRGARSQVHSTIAHDAAGNAIEDSINLDNNATGHTEELFAVTMGKEMSAITFAMFQTFLIQMDKIGVVKSMQSVQLAMFTIGFNYASYLHEQRELAQFADKLAQDN